MKLHEGFRFRAFVSLLATFCFLTALVTGTILYITPPGRIANWENWTLWGLTKHQWIALHICFNAMFVIVLLLHIWLNWKLLLGYFVGKHGGALRLRLEWIVALIVCVIVFWGALTPYAPFSFLLNFNQHCQCRWGIPNELPPIPPSGSEGGQRHGSGKGGGGFGQKTLTQACQEMNLPVQEAINILKAAGISASENETIRTIADKNYVHPSEIRKLLQHH